MPALGEAQIQAMLNRLADRVDVTVGAVTVKGVVDQTDETMFALSPELIGKVIVVHVKTGALALSMGVSITVAGTAYKVHDFAQFGDGAVTRVSCALP